MPNNKEVTDVAGKENLKAPRTPEEAREKGRRGGVKSGEARRAKRDARETAQLFLNMAVAGNLDDILAKLEIKEGDRTNQMGIVARLTLKAQGGDVHAARLLWEITGQMPKNSENNFNVNVGKDDDESIVIYIPDNGRDSGKARGK